mmetsp:Transcript_13386/g.35968  ORF Transcript_13386/g.35968 Transcript_13386/m.35968 type:complete len:429 (-) Transcript_13386:101-1387(-)
MSFRELRQFCEIMRSLGYHRIVSMENFRRPNFQLVADVCDWLLHRFEPHCNIPDDISTEAHRVDFIKAVCQKALERTGTKLNARKLYGADGRAVQEMLKLAVVLYDAQLSVARGEGNRDDICDDSPALQSKLSEVVNARAVCSDIIESGAGLFDLLQKEHDTSKDREKALRFLDGISRNLDSNTEHAAVEAAVSGMLSSHGERLSQVQKMTEELQSDERVLDQKIRKKRQELDRCAKRLANLSNVRPAFMDEYETLEQEFERYYEQYVGRFRNLDYLEHEVDALNKEETERMEENDRRLKRMQKRLRDEEWQLLRGEEDEAGGKSRKPKRGMGNGKLWMPPSGSVNAEGSMDAGDESDSGSDVLAPSVPGSGSVDSESEDPEISVGNDGGSRFGGDDDDIASESDEDILEEDVGMDSRYRRNQDDFDF